MDLWIVEFVKQILFTVRAFLLTSSFIKFLLLLWIQNFNRNFISYKCYSRSINMPRWVYWFLLYIDQTNCFIFSYPAEIASCVLNEGCRNGGDVVVRVGGSFNLTCTLPDSGVTVEFSKNNTVLLSENNSRTITLTLENVTRSDAGTYFCVKDKKPVVGIVVKIGSIPMKPVFDNCVNYDGERMVCVFDLKSTKDKLINPRFQVIYRVGNVGGVCNDARVTGQTLTCIWQRGGSNGFLNFLPYEISAHTTTEIGNATSDTTIVNPNKYLKPPAITTLAAVNFFNFSVLIQWKRPSKLACLVVRLQYNVTIIGDNGDRQQAEQITDNCKSNLTTIVGNLVPYSNYTILITSKPKESGYRSDVFSTIIQTPTSVPRSAPSISNSYYSQHEVDDKYRHVVIYWKPYNKTEKGGEINLYRIALQSSQSGVTEYLTQDVSGTAQSVLLNHKLRPDYQYKIFLQAQTTAGLSQPSTLLIPQQYESLVKATMVTAEKINVTDYLISWKQDNKTLGQANLVKLHYCYGNVFEGSKIVNCKTGLIDIIIPADEHQYRLRLKTKPNSFCEDCRWQFSISMETKPINSGMIWSKCRFLYNGDPASPGFDSAVVGRTSIRLTWTTKCNLDARSARPMMYQLAHVSSSEQNCHNGNILNITADQDKYERTLEDLLPTTLYYICIRSLSREGSYNDWIVENFTTTSKETPFEQDMDIIIGIVIGVSLVVICCCCLAANGRNGLYKPYSIKVDSDISQEQTPRESEMSTDMANANYKLLEVEEPQETSFSHQGRDEQILTESRTSSSGVAYIISLSVDEDEPGGEQVTGTSHSHQGSDVGGQERQHNEKTIETDPCPSASSIGMISNESGGYVVCAFASSTPDSQKPINQTESDPRQRDSSNGMKFSENEGYVANGCTPYPPVPPASDSQEI